MATLLILHQHSIESILEKLDRILPRGSTISCETLLGLRDCCDYELDFTMSVREVFENYMKHRNEVKYDIGALVRLLEEAFKYEYNN